MLPVRSLAAASPSAPEYPMPRDAYHVAAINPAVVIP
jgi:hypothetical protein